MELIKVPSKLGCDGCWYDNRPDCPAFKDENGKWNFIHCADEDGNQLIFVPAKDESQLTFVPQDNNENENENEE